MSEESEIEKRKEKAIEYLSKLRKQEKRPDQLTAEECAKFLGFKNIKSVRAMMSKLVEEGTWETALVSDENCHNIRVWWIKE